MGNQPLETDGHVGLSWQQSLFKMLQAAAGGRVKAAFW